MARPRLNLDTMELPIHLGPIPRPIDDDLVERCLAGLAHRCPGSRQLVEQGLAPPQSLTGNTIFLAYHHFDLAGGIYAREQVTYHRPVRIGDTLSVEGEIMGSYLRRGRRYRVMTSYSRNGVGELAVSSRSTSVERFRRQDPGPRQAENETEPPMADPAPGPDPSAAASNPCRATLEGLTPGARAPGQVQVVRLKMMQDLAGEDSRNPIHTDPEMAQREGLGAPIAAGPHVLAFVQEAMMERLGPQALLYGAHFDVRWIRPLRAETAIIPTATVGQRASGCVRFELSVRLAQDDGESVMVGEAKLPI